MKLDLPVGELKKGPDLKLIYRQMAGFTPVGGGGTRPSHELLCPPSFIILYFSEVIQILEMLKTFLHAARSNTSVAVSVGLGDGPSANLTIDYLRLAWAKNTFLTHVVSRSL